MNASPCVSPPRKSTEGSLTVHSVVSSSRPRKITDRTPRRAHIGEAAENPLEVLSGAYSEPELKDFSEPIDEDGQAENYGYHAPIGRGR